MTRDWLTHALHLSQAAEFLQSTEYLDCVEKMVEAAKAQGINGVPFVIIDGKWAVNGVQPVECFIQVSPVPSIIINPLVLGRYV